MCEKPIAESEKLFVTSVKRFLLLEGLFSHIFNLTKSKNFGRFTEVLFILKQ